MIQLDKYAESFTNTELIKARLKVSQNESRRE
jgi:hypothetical protein